MNLDENRLLNCQNCMELRHTSVLVKQRKINSISLSPPCLNFFTQVSSLANPHPPASSPLSYSSYTKRIVKAVLCFLWDMWSQTSSSFSFFNSAHAVSRGSVALMLTFRGLSALFHIHEAHRFPQGNVVLIQRQYTILFTLRAQAVLTRISHGLPWQSGTLLYNTEPATVIP